MQSPQLYFADLLDAIVWGRCYSVWFAGGLFPYLVLLLGFFDNCQEGLNAFYFKIRGFVQLLKIAGYCYVCEAGKLLCGVNFGVSISVFLSASIFVDSFCSHVCGWQELEESWNGCYTEVCNIEARGMSLSCHEGNIELSIS